ncbi:uncharacterized protein LOC100748835 [Bombus impatiens]|uniref:Uncharacterized protein LOC100748835 n=1 Tax=Bombus impatiens TaxID=132113 RepID=A0A6P3DKX0_BOMIM|nr:uncharacterized protein LOC100748835 [Bombus impatiens]
MKLSIEKLLSVVILSIVSLSHVKAVKVTITDFYVDVSDNDLVVSWSPSLSDNLISSQIFVKQDCPGEIEADITIYNGDDVINEMNKIFDKPIKELEGYNICASIETPNSEDDSCSLAQGEQAISDCDVSDFFSGMNPGDYTAKFDFKQDDNLVSTATLKVKVEAEQE